MSCIISDPWDLVYVQTRMVGFVWYIILVGKYSNHMDPMGLFLLAKEGHICYFFLV